MADLNVLENGSTYVDGTNKDISGCLVFSSADSVSSAELMVLLIVCRPSSVVRRPSSVLPSTFALNRYSSYSSYSKILNFLLEKLGI